MEDWQEWFASWLKENRIDEVTYFEKQIAKAAFEAGWDKCALHNSNDY